jgi:hypothetical protein
MDSDADKPRPVPKRLLSELDRSRDDVAAGRMSPVGPVLIAIHTRASRRIEQREKARKIGEEKLVEPS